MKLKNGKLGPSGRKAQSILTALLLMFFVGGSAFNATAQRDPTTMSSNQTFAGQTSEAILDEPSSLSEFPESSSAFVFASADPFQELYCASDDGRRHYCNIDTRDGVRLVRQRSDAACIQGRTWGYDRRGIWVDRGCRADFVAGNRGRDRDYGRDRDRDRRESVQTFYCESGDGKRHWCSEGIGGSVRLIRQRSGSPCIQGRTWGQDRSGVWVDRGCRADFEVRRR